MQRDNNHPTIVTIQDIIQETPTVKTLIYTDEVMSSALPGQFAMVWIPDIGELPMSIMIDPEPDRAAFTVRRHGVSSTGLFDLHVGDSIGVRGPYGNTFDLKHGKVLMVGGGTGLVPMMRLLTQVKRDDDVTLVMGAKTKSEVFFEDLAESLLSTNPHRILVSTDDGSYGQSGLVTDIVDQLISKETFDGVYTCGPEMMMYKTVKSANTHGVFVQASLERVMKCGVGICGSCCMGRDLVCRDGTVFDGIHLEQNNEFGHIYKSKSGIQIRY